MVASSTSNPSSKSLDFSYLDSSHRTPLRLSWSSSHECEIRGVHHHCALFDHETIWIESFIASRTFGSNQTSSPAASSDFFGTLAWRGWSHCSRTDLQLRSRGAARCCRGSRACPSSTCYSVPLIRQSESSLIWPIGFGNDHLIESWCWDSSRSRSRDRAGSHDSRLQLITLKTSWIFW